MVSAEKTARDRRVEAQRAGLRAEALAALWLRLKGYRILARRLRTPVGEIDLVARRGRRIAFVEVKRRDAAGDALAAVTPQQQRRVRRAAGAWLSRQPDAAGCDSGFDVIVVAPWRLPEHLVDAFSHMAYEAGSGSGWKRGR